MASLVDRYVRIIKGVISCFDRVIIMGTVPRICYAGGMENFLYANSIRIYDYPRFAKPFAADIRANAERVAQDNGIEIEFIRRARDFRKEDRIREIIQERGDHPGLVHIFSAMEQCSTYRPARNMKGVPVLRGGDGKCLHYYFYFIHEQFGLCYLRVPTWCPFRLQFYFNGHNWLANQMRREGIEFTQVDNAFVAISDWERAQVLAHSFPVQYLHEELDRLAEEYCPVLHHFGERYHWSLSQAEFALDIVFRSRKDLQPIYEALIRTMVHAVKPEHIATFFGRKIDPKYEGEIGGSLNTRIAGTSVRHHMGAVSIGAYDKYGHILRIEVRTDDVTCLRHYRAVEHRDGTETSGIASMRKTIYSMPPLRDACNAAARRYLDFLSGLDDTSGGEKQIPKISEPVRHNERTYRGFNLFSASDLEFLRALFKVHLTPGGFRNKDLRRFLPALSGSQVSRMLKRLLLHRLVRKVGATYRYHITKLGWAVLIAAMRVRECVVLPTIARVAA